MSSKFSSCFGTFLLIVVGTVVLRFALPEIWLILSAIFRGAMYFGVFILLAVLAVIGYFTFQNLRKNKQKREEKRIAHVTQTEALYASVVERLQKDLTLNQVTAEEFLQSEILIGEKLPEISNDLIRLKEFASAKNESQVNQQIRDYKQQLQQSRDPAARQVVAENLKILEEKKQRMESALEEIRRKEASVDLVYNSLVNVDEDLKFGRPVRRLFPPDLYARFQLTAPGEQPSLPPLTEKSSLE